DNDIQIPYGTSIPGRASTSVTLQGNLDASAAAPEATVLTSSAPYTAGGSPATASTLLNNLDSNVTPYQTGDSILINGVDANGNTISTSLSVSATTTMGDLVTAINGAFTGATASIDSAGNLVLKANNTGPANLSLTLSDAAGNTGQTQFSSHALAVTTAGQDGATVPTAIQVYDPQGTAHTLNLLFQKTGNNTWNLTASINPSEGTMINGQVTGITFNDDGSFSQVSSSSQISFQIVGMSQPQTVNLDFGTPGGFSGVTQYGGATSAAAVAQDGYSAGVLSTVAIAQDGTITGTFSNGKSLALAQMSLATFTNPDALQRQGSNYFAVTHDSGIANIGTPNSGNRGYLQAGTLEQSNVDVSLEFTRLITAQRGFQANARTIRVSDEVLQDLVTLIQ
ncbi:MAG TPA: flagellar hook-basal body complex protein, partial [Gemmataceae bacterium]|nr:flagellar hook-basal body complex protein [Gemmataceae bacterium]